MSELNELMAITGVVKRADKINALRENGSFFEIGHFDVEKEFESFGIGEWKATPGTLYQITAPVFKMVKDQFLESDVSSEVYALIKEEKIKNIVVYYEYLSEFINKIITTPMNLIGQTHIHELEVIQECLGQLENINELKTHKYYNRIKQLGQFIPRAITIITTNGKNSRTFKDLYGLK